MYERSPPLSLAKRQTQLVELPCGFNVGTAKTVVSIAAHVRLPRRADPAAAKRSACTQARASPARTQGRHAASHFHVHSQRKMFTPILRAPPCYEASLFSRERCARFHRYIGTGNWRCVRSACSRVRFARVSCPWLRFVQVPGSPRCLFTVQVQYNRTVQYCTGTGSGRLRACGCSCGC
jgi:hypothetical protein